jgi:hypothetical protein
LVRLSLVRGSAQCEANCLLRLLMGFVAFLVLMSAEVGLGAVFGRSLVDQLATYRSAPGAIGLGAQVIFAMFPVVQIWRW